MINPPPPGPNPLAEAAALLERAHQLLLGLPPSEGAVLSPARTKIMEAMALVQERRRAQGSGAPPFSGPFIVTR